MRTGWTKEQYQEWLKRSQEPAAAMLTLPRDKKVKAGRTRAWKPPEKTKTEAEFELMLKDDWPQMTILYGQVKVQIDESCWFLPDFYIPQLQTFWEVKGSYIYEDSVIKFKSARRIHAWATWQMWQKKAGVWKRLH